LCFAQTIATLSLSFLFFKVDLKDDGIDMRGIALHLSVLIANHGFFDRLGDWQS
jgi:hypothetical protein